MKKFCIIFFLSIIISVTAFSFNGCFGTQKTETDEYLRIHIRADSNAEDAQAVKYLVRDEVVAYLTPLVAQYQDKKAALTGLQAHLPAIQTVAERVLKQNGYGYGATASVERAEFPTRVYDGYTLPAGEYDALIIRLGTGKGDNWWCVAYPPLCFAATPNTDIVYKSKIAEIIRRWCKD